MLPHWSVRSAGLRYCYHRDPKAALAALNAIESPARNEYQHYWVVRAHALRLAGSRLAAEAYQRAIGLTEDDAVRRYLRSRASNA